MKKSLFGVLIASILAFGANAQSGADAALGIWYNAEKDGKIQLYKQGDKYFGKIVWLKEPNDNAGKPKLDTNNEDTKLRNRPIIGLQIIKDFGYTGDSVWEGGKIYDPKNGKLYSCKMTLKNKNTLDVRGFVGMALLGRTTTWTRAE